MNYKYESMYNKSSSGKSSRVVRKNKNMKKDKHKKLVKNMLILAVTFCVGSQVVYGINQENKLKNDLKNSNEYMRTKIVSYLEESGLDYSILEDEIIFENDEEKISDLIRNLTNDGFSKNEILYMISQVCSEKDFDNMAKNYGYESSEEFINKYKSGSVLDTNEEYFEKKVRDEYIEIVDEIIESEENKGIKR